MKTIQLTQNQVALVDDDDYEYLSQWKWFAHRDPKNNCFYALRNEGKHPHRTTVPMHKVIVNDDAVIEIDHVNHNTLDNRKENLRPCNDHQNQYNRAIQKNNKSGYKGVYWHKGKWTVQIRTDKGTFFEYYTDKILAARAYDRLAKKYHGEFAYLNFPESQ